MNVRAILAQSSRPIIIGHQNADPDAVCSMLAARSLYLSINPQGNPTLVCEDVSKLSNQVLDTLELSKEIHEFSKKVHDLTILVDTNSKSQLGPRVANLLGDPSRTLVIDHHEENPDIQTIAQHTLINTKASSTCEMVFELFEELNVEPDTVTANLLLTGILFDSRRFFHSGEDALEVALKLVEAGADYQTCVNSLIIRPERSERIARIKAAGRLKLHTIDDWIVVTSRVKAYEASACRGLLELGADAAIVGGVTSSGRVRISSRSTRKFSEETDVNLGTDVMEPIGELIGGEGGGHANAAGANGTKNRDHALERSVELIRKAIEKNAAQREKQAWEAADPWR
ncbi:MAG: bifunctional oligoribonuclease/PAP phosphatase NrnA [Candidatus Thorarchaeota archaeon]